MNERGLLFELGMAAMTLLNDDGKFRWLIDQGVSSEILRTGSGPLGAARIYPDQPEKGLFEYADCEHREDDSLDVIIQGVFFHGIHGRLLDLVAWNPRRPEQWWLRLGGPLTWIGEGAVLDAAWPYWEEALQGGPQPGLSLYPTPLAWLQCGARNDGAVLLDGGGRLWRDLLAGVEKVSVEDNDFAAHVYKQIRKRPPTFKLPEVWVDGPQKDEAAV